MRKASKSIFRAMALTLALLMAVSLLPSYGFAANEPAAQAEGTDGLKLKKTAVLQADGTYKITLEAYAIGEVNTTVAVETVPTDIILVLDQSGSMTEETISGIPSGFVTADPSHGEAMTGTYYILDGDIYRRVTVTREIVASKTIYIGQDGKEYREDELAYSWTRPVDGRVFNTATPYVKSSLQLYQREKEKIWGAYTGPCYYYNVSNPDDNTKKNVVLNAKSAREEFIEKKKTDANTVEFQNDGNPGGGWANDNPYYVAAVYTAVTPTVVNTYKYTYTYTDVNGETAVAGTWTGAESDHRVNPSLQLYQAGATRTGTRLEALQYAAQTFIDEVHANAVANNADHRVAVVGFASDGSRSSYLWSNTELFVGATQYNYGVNGQNSTYNKAGNLAADHYGEAFQSARTNEGYGNLTASINALAGRGGTMPSYGFKMAQGIYDANSTTYVKADGTTAERKKIVIFLTDGMPGMYGDDTTEANSALNEAGTLKGARYNATIYTMAVLDREATGSDKAFLENVSSSGSYSLALSTQNISDFFSSIQSTITSTTSNVELTATALLSDVISDEFCLPDDFSVENNITVQVAKHYGNETFATPEAAPRGVSASVNGKTISVSGFDYVSAENMVTTSVSEGGSTVGQGHKLVVTIDGVLATDTAVKDVLVSTNLASSGIYDKDNKGNYAMIKAFEQPWFDLTARNIVLDYGQYAELLASGTVGIDDARDGILNKLTGASTVSGNYGVFGQSGQQVTYTPNTTNWDGYDSFYALTESNGVYNWVKIHVIPASSVLYEENFAAIDYSQAAGSVAQGTDQNNAEDPNGPIHGNIGSLHGQLNDTNGTSVLLNKNGQKVSFTFTGTGVDVYGRTFAQSAVIALHIYKNNVLKYVQIVDTESLSDTYYSIPVAAKNLPYDTYKAEIMILNADEGFYLDAVRVYNPLGDTADPVVNAAYSQQGLSGGEKIFTTLRDTLINHANADGQLAGTVFIDKAPDGTNVVSEYSVYGPKHEIYLKNGQSVALNLGTPNATVYVGLKAPAGVAAQVGDNVIDHSADLYYALTTDADGILVIQNAGDGLLAITKMMVDPAIVPDGIDTFALLPMSAEAAVAAVNAFETAASAPVEPETPAEPEVPTVPEQPVEISREEIEQIVYRVIQRLIRRFR